MTRTPTGWAWERTFDRIDGDLPKGVTNADIRERGAGVGVRPSSAAKRKHYAGERPGGAGRFPAPVNPNKGGFGHGDFYVDGYAAGLDSRPPIPPRRDAASCRPITPENRALWLQGYDDGMAEAIAMSRRIAAKRGVA